MTHAICDNNTTFHYKITGNKQQKRKSKATISIWALHDLQEQARPSDSCLFYPDVKEEIKHVTAAKLEGFIAMKTRPIHNSVSKWADQARSKVKSIIEWIKTGGNNNKAVLERLEKRHRDHFRHKAHKKPRKKTKGRNSTVYSTLRQTPLSSYITLKNDLYWSLRGFTYPFQEQKLNKIRRVVVNWIFNSVWRVMSTDVAGLWLSIHWLVSVMFSI